MRIFFIVDETLFLLPEWLDNVVYRLKKEEKIVGLTPLTTKGKPTWSNYITKNLYKLSIASIARLVNLAVVSKLKQILFLFGLSKKPASTTQVAKKHKLKIVPTQNVNNPSYFKKIKKLEPDIIVSSCSQIFKKRLLDLPKVACINRHSALLPSYGGVFPIFWAILSGEKEIGVTIHYMTKKIDRGPIIYQKSFPAKRDDSLFALYKRAYKESIGATLKAIQIVKTGDEPVVVKRTKPSYYSFPTDRDWKKFYQMGYKFI